MENAALELMLEASAAVEEDAIAGIEPAASGEEKDEMTEGEGSETGEDKEGNVVSDLFVMRRDEGLVVS